MNSAQKLFDLFEVTATEQKPRNERVNHLEDSSKKINDENVGDFVRHFYFHESACCFGCA